MESNNVAASKAVLHATVTVTRAATGKVETYQLTGTPMDLSTAQQIAQPQQKEEN